MIIVRITIIMIIATTKATNAQAGKAQIHCLKKFQISRERNIATPSTLYNLSDNAKKKKKADKEKRLKKNLRCLPKKILTYQGSVSKKRKSILNCEPGGTVTVHTQ